MTKDNSSRPQHNSDNRFQRRSVLKSVVGAMAGLVARTMVPVTLSSVTLCSVTVTATVMGSDTVPGAPQKNPIVLRNGVIHTVSGPPISDGMLVFDQGRIVDVGANLSIPENAEVIDLKGREVWPSMIEANSQLGLTEIASVRATLDYAEAGLLNPNVSAHVAVNPDSELIPVTRANGVLIALTSPIGGLVSGKASVLQLDGWTYEDMTLKPDAAMVINWPRVTPFGGRGFRPPGAPDAPADEGSNQSLKTLRDLFEQARIYQKARSSNPAEQRHDIRLEAMIPVVEGRMPIYVTANRVREIQSAVSFAAEQKVRMILFGGADAEMCAELLKQHQVPVIIDSIHRAPSRNHDAYDAAYTLPERLRRAGVKFCISGSSRAETYNVRNLPYQAATAVAYGLPYEDGVRSVTIYPAEILGIADRVGTLDKGKDATLFVSDGDPLETETQIEMAWIQGRKVDLNNRHRQLYEKYSEKYQQLKAANK